MIGLGRIWDVDIAIVGIVLITGRYLLPRAANAVTVALRWIG